VGCTSLASVDLPAGLTTIGSYVFVGCSSLASVDLPAGLTSINDAAFRYCTSLASIDLPAGLTSMGIAAFYGCTSLTSLTCRASTPPTLHPNVLTETPASLVIRVPAASVNAYKSAPGWSDYAGRINAIP
jgi:hypothetical protein